MNKNELKGLIQTNVQGKIGGAVLQNTLKAMAENLYCGCGGPSYPPPSEPSGTVRTVTASNAWIGPTSSHIANDVMYLVAGTVVAFDLLNETFSPNFGPNNTTMGSTIYKDKIYAPLSGLNSGGQGLIIFDLLNKTSRTITLTERFERYTCVCHNDKLYIPTNNGSKIDVFDIVNENWEEISVPGLNANGRSVHTCFIHDNKLYVPAFGMGSNGCNMYIFDLRDYSYRMIGLPETTCAYTNQIYKNKVYLPNGSASSAANNVNMCIFDLQTEEVRTVIMPNRFSRQSSSIYQDKLYIQEYNMNSRLLEIFDLRTEEVTTVNMSNSNFLKTFQTYRGRMYTPLENPGGARIEIYTL